MDGVLLLLLHDGDRQKLSCIPRVAAVAVLVSSPWWWQQRTCRLHGVDHSDDGEGGVSGGVGDVDVDRGRGAADRCDRCFRGVGGGVDHWPSMVMSSCHCCCFVASLCRSSSNTCSQLRVS